MHVLSLTAKSMPRQQEVFGYHLHRARLDMHLASTGFSLSAFKRFAALVRDVDVVHYHFPWPFMDLVHFATRIGKPSVVTYHSDIVRQQNLLKLYRPLKNRFLGSMDRIVATSPNYLATSEVLAKHQGRVEVIPIGLDRASYPSPDAGRLQYWRDRLGTRLFLFVGVLRYYKGLHILLEAAKGTDLTIAIAGAGPIEEELKAQANALGLTNMHFLGQVDEGDKTALLHLCQAVVFPSHLRSEAFGITLLEGAMYGKPMISSEIGTGTSFINISNETGLVVPPSDPNALREAMLKLQHSPETAKQMGAAAQRRFESHFTAGQMVDAYVDLYGRVIGEFHSRKRG
jgi:rhamnosyl/mannosyltransferase